MARKKPGSRPLPEGLVKAIAVNAGAGIDAPGLLNGIIEGFGDRHGGGRAALCRAIVAEFKTAKPGSMVRQRIIEMISRLTIVVTTQEFSKERSASDMTDEELLASVGRTISRMEQNSGPPASPAAAATKTPYRPSASDGPPDTGPNAPPGSLDPDPAGEPGVL